MRGTKNLQTALCFIMSLLITLCFMSLGPGPRKSSGPLPLAGAEEVTSPQTDTSLVSVLKSELGHTLLFTLCYVFTATIFRCTDTDAALCAKLQPEICPGLCSLVMTPTILCRSDDSFLEVERCVAHGIRQNLYFTFLQGNNT